MSSAGVCGAEPPQSVSFRQAVNVVAPPRRRPDAVPEAAGVRGARRKSPARRGPARGRQLETREGGPVTAPAAPARLLTLAQAADVLGVHERTLRAWIAAGQIRVVRLGARTVRIRPAGS